ncbi:MAG: T9SS type A sorting domain-containing protein, partial [Opitutaceae bacterium]|nr:T9SS type A sorting domain-containing protein [Cytophagales bacterium]
MKNIRVILCALLNLVIISKISAQNANFHIYLCFGQSNMEGQGPIETQDQTVDNRFQIMQAVNCTGQPQNTWRTAKPPLARCNTKLGPSDYFGREMVKNLPTNIKVGIVLVAVAGCKIELFDKTNYASYAAGQVQWMKDIIAQYGGNPYGRLVELAKLAQKDGVIKGILFHQGESNVGDGTWATKVNKVYNNLLTDLNLTASKVPFLAGEVVQGGAAAGANTMIDNLPKTIPTAYVISSSGLGAQSDNLHFTSASYRTLGQRYAQKMLILLPATVTSIEEENKDLATSVYPNPSLTDFTINEPGQFNYTLSNSEGQVLYEGNGNNSVVLGNTLTEGIYFLKINKYQGSKV